MKASLPAKTVKWNKVLAWTGTFMKALKSRFIRVDYRTNVMETLVGERTF